MAQLEPAERLLDYTDPRTLYYVAYHYLLALVAGHVLGDLDLDELHTRSVQVDAEVTYGERCAGQRVIMAAPRPLTPESLPG